MKGEDGWKRKEMVAVILVISRQLSRRRPGKMSCIGGIFLVVLKSNNSVMVHT